jgi:hypothetical protein
MIFQQIRWLTENIRLWNCGSSTFRSKPKRRQARSLLLSSPNPDIKVHYKYTKHELELKHGPQIHLRPRDSRWSLSRGLISFYDYLKPQNTNYVFFFQWLSIETSPLMWRGRALCPAHLICYVRRLM